jgi:hypothetical protein
MLLPLSKKIGLRMLLLIQKEVEMSVESCRSDLCAGGQLLQPLLAATRTVDIHAPDQDTT